MRFQVHDIIFDIDDAYVWYSPYLYTLLNTGVGIERSDGSITLDVDPNDFKEYISYLEGNTPIMNRRICRLFDYMGHTNRMKYSPDVWGMKLHDEWIRDNMYNLRLYEDPLYDLVEVPIIRELPVSVPDGWYVAGGAALWMAGKIDKLNDIDLFTCMDKDKATESMKFLNEDGYNVSVSGNSITYVEGTPDRLYQVQFILRLYKAPTEIVHGFDLDCVGVIYVDGKLYMTRRAKFSNDRCMNYFDPKRASPSYVYRLIKYMKRKYHIYLPHITLNDIDHVSIGRFMDDIRSRYYQYVYGGRYTFGGDDRFKKQRGDKVMKKVKKAIDLLSNNRGMIFMAGDKLYEAILGAIISDDPTRKYQEHEMYRYASSVMPILDPVSILILGVFHNFYPLTIRHRVGDYSIAEDKESTSSPEPFSVKWDILTWKEQNPMDQVSSTCVPTPIDDLHEWYRTSPFHKDATTSYVPDEELKPKKNTHLSFE